MLQLTPTFMAWTAGIVLGTLTLMFTVVLVQKPKQHDPQMGQAQGCLMLVLLGFLVLDGLLVLAVFAEWTRLLGVLFTLVVLPVAWMLLGLVYNIVRRWGRKRHE